MEINKRQLQRRHIRSYMGVHLQSNQKLLGQLVDITQHGVLVITEEEVESGWQAELFIQLSRELDGEETIRFTARSVWCEADINPDYFAVGFEIVHPDHRTAGLIEMLIERYGLSIPKGQEGRDSNESGSQ